MHITWVALDTPGVCRRPRHFTVQLRDMYRPRVLAVRESRPWCWVAVQSRGPTDVDSPLSLLANANTQASWKGKLPPMLVHHRHFPREEGQFKRLEEPITLKGSICRSDWVDGASTRCRITAEEGEERRGWSPSGCSLCNTLRSSPCCDIFARSVGGCRLLVNHGSYEVSSVARCSRCTDTPSDAAGGNV